MGTFSDSVLNKSGRIFVPHGTNDKKGRIKETREEILSRPAPETTAGDVYPEILRGYEIDSEKKEYNSKIDKFRSSYIENDEEELEAKRQIEEHLGFEVPRVCGYHMVVKIYVRPEDIREITKDNGEKISIYLPEIVTHGDKFRNCVALVLNKGSECYTGKRFEGREPWCRIGDWVIIARNAGPQLNYRGVPVTYLPDDQIYGVVPDPTFVTRD